MSRLVVRSWNVAYDISTGKAEPDLRVVRFGEFYATSVGPLSQAFQLCAQDDDLAHHALANALAATSQRWRQIAHHRFPLGWAFAQGLKTIEAGLADRPSAHKNEATGGYVRGLDLDDAVSSLPLSQRAALVATHFLEWSADEQAIGLAIPASTVDMRYDRALGHLVHHLKDDVPQVQSQVAARFALVSEGDELVAPSIQDVERQGRQTRMRNRLLAGAAVFALIVLGGLVLQVARPAPAGPEIVEPVSPPVASADWFAPVSDGQGGFVALNTRGASRFVSSTDGIEWFPAATWNSRAVDLRTEVTSFQRSGGRFVTTIEAGASTRSLVPPRVATSDDLKTWEVLELNVQALRDAQGVLPSVEILSVAATANDVLVAVGVNETIDYGSLGIQRSDVCVESAQGETVILHLCDGANLETPQALSGLQHRFFVSNDGAQFRQAQLPPDADPYSLFSFGPQFGVRHIRDGGVYISADGMAWNLFLPGASDQRLSLAKGSPSGEWVVLVPGQDRWFSHVFQDNLGFEASPPLPIDLDPQSIWIKPQLTSGPAGWALFVTTSRPWERTDVTQGWAIDDGTWIVARQPDSKTISARSVDGARAYRFNVDSEFVAIDPLGSVTLRDPQTNEVIVVVSRDQIDESRGVSTDVDPVRARVLFSSNGIDWTSIWASEIDTWLGSIAVGDDEVVLTGINVMSPPIVVALHDS